MRIKSVKSSRKEWKCGSCGSTIHVGEPYKWAKGRYTGKKVRCKNCRFRQSDLVTSDKLARIFSAQETIEDLHELDFEPYLVTPDEDGQAIEAGEIEAHEVEYDFEAIVEAIKELIQQAADEAREVGEEYQESYDNMPDSLQETEQADEIQEKADACEQFASDLEEYIESAFGLVPSTMDDVEALIAGANEIELDGVF